MILCLVITLCVLTPLVAYYGVIPAMKGSFTQSPTLTAMNSTAWAFSGYAGSASLTALAVPLLIGAGILFVVVIVLLGKSEKSDVPRGRGTEALTVNEHIKRQTKRLEGSNFHQLPLYSLTLEENGLSILLRIWSK